MIINETMWAVIRQDSEELGPFVLSRTMSYRKMDSKKLYLDVFGRDIEQDCRDGIATLRRVRVALEDRL